MAEAFPACYCLQCFSLRTSRLVLRTVAAECARLSIEEQGKLRERPFSVDKPLERLISSRNFEKRKLIVCVTRFLSLPSKKISTEAHKYNDDN